MGEITVALDGIMGDAAQHGESIVRAYIEFFSHPRVEGGERKVSASHTFRQSCRPRREGQGADAVRADDRKSFMKILGGGKRHRF